MTKRRSKKCVFCQAAEVTKQHVIHRAWKNKVVVPDSPSEFESWQNGKTVIRPDAPLFELQVRQVCQKCNGGWMNDIELAVEEWIINPNILDPSFSAKTFRRWAVMTAMMRSYVDHPKEGVVPLGDLQRLYLGEDVQEWHVYVGKTNFRQIKHTFTGLGKGDAETGLHVGLITASFVVGEAVLFCLRILGVDPETEKSVKSLFESRYVRLVDYLTPVPAGDLAMPHLILKPAIPLDPLFEMGWFYTNDKDSPLSNVMGQLYGTLSNAQDE